MSNLHAEDDIKLSFFTHIVLYCRNCSRRICVFGLQQESSYLSHKRANTRGNE